jgi:hypothetical protein
MGRTQEQDMKIAHSIIFTSCQNPECRLIHIHFLDEAGETFAMAPMDIESIPGIVKDIQDIAYEIISLRGEQK